MHKFIFVAFLLLLSLFPLSAQQKVACIGNSITEGFGLQSGEAYPSILQTLLDPSEFTVRNFGVSARTMLKKGDFPYWNESKYKQALEWNPDIVIIKLGTNDAKAYNWAYKNEFKANYTEFVNSFKNLSSKPKIFVCYPLPAFPDNWILIDDKVLTDEMMPMITSVAEETQSAIIDLHTPFKNKEKLVFDKVHPNVKGTTFMAHLIASEICPTCVVAPLPDNFLQQIATFDYTDKLKNAATSSSNLDLIPLFDNDGLTGISIPHAEQTWVSIEVNEEIKVTGYGLTVGDKPEANPRSWKLQGSASGRLWYTIDKRDNEEFETLETLMYEVPFTSVESLSAYKYYRMLFSDTNGANEINLNEFQLFGIPKDRQKDITDNGGQIMGQHDGFPGEKVENLIDNKLTTKYCVVEKAGGWIQYESPVKVSIQQYALTSCFDLYERNLKDWQLLASNDGAEWDVLDSQSNQEFGVRFSTMLYDVVSEKEYTFFRLNITAVNSSRTFQLSEWQLFERTTSSIGQTEIKGNIYSLNGKMYIETEGVYQYRIFDALGKCIDIGVVTQGGHVIDGCLPGLYYLQVYSRTESTVAKLIL